MTKAKPVLLYCDGWHDGELKVRVVQCRSQQHFAFQLRKPTNTSHFLKYCILYLQYSQPNLQLWLYTSSMMSRVPTGLKSPKCFPFVLKPHPITLGTFDTLRQIPCKLPTILHEVQRICHSRRKFSKLLERERNNGARHFKSSRTNRFAISQSSRRPFLSY